MKTSCHELRTKTAPRTPKTYAVETPETSTESAGSHLNPNYVTVTKIYSFVAEYFFKLEIILSFETMSPKDKARTMESQRISMHPAQLCSQSRNSLTPRMP